LAVADLLVEWSNALSNLAGTGRSRADSRENWLLVNRIE